MKQKKLINEGQWEANYAYFALHKLHIKVSDFISMDRYEKAFTIACIDIRIEKEKKEEEKIKRKSKRR